MPATLFSIAALVVLVGVVIFRAIPAARAYFTYRGTRLIRCPETRTPEAIKIKAGKAAARSLWCDPELRLSQCSRWPERHDCGQECLRQVEADPENCLLWNIVSGWYEGKSCVYCQKPFGPLHHLDHAPALRAPDGKTAEWKEFQPQQLPEIFGTCQPVCWNCHVTETFRREYPELVVERGR